MRVLLCDGHLMLVEAVAMVLEKRGHTVLRALSPSSALEIAEQQSVDACVIDLRFPGDRGIPAVDAIRKLAGAVDVVVLTGDPGGAGPALEAGARAVVDKGSAIERVVRVLEDESQRGRVGGFDAHAATELAAPAGVLTARELEVLEALVDGETTASLATRLGIGPATVRTHVQNVLQKLGVHSRLEAVAFAVGSGLVPVRVRSTRPAARGE